MGLELIKGSDWGGDDMCAYNTILNIILTIFDHLGPGQNMHILLYYFIFKKTFGRMS